MLLASFSSFFINEARLIGPFSPIHLLSIMVIYNMWRGVRAIRAKNIKAHRGYMYGAAVFGLGVAGLFTFLPGRLNYDLLMMVFK